MHENRITVLTGKTQCPIIKTVEDIHSRTQRCLWDDKVNDMKTITVPQFVDLLKTATITANSEISDTVWSEDSDKPDMVWGWIWNELVVDGLKINYQNSYEHPARKPSLATTFSDVPDIWMVEQKDFVVVDEDGDELDLYEMGEIIIEHTDIDSLDSNVLGEDENELIDIDEDSDMGTIIVKRDNDRDIKFTGEEIASASSSANNAHPSYSGSTGRWTELTLYRTKGGKYICEQVGYTQWQGEKTRYSGCVCESIDQVVEFFGTRWLAKDLYENADIDATVEAE